MGKIVSAMKIEGGARDYICGAVDITIDRPPTVGDAKRVVQELTKGLILTSMRMLGYAYAESLVGEDSHGIEVGVDLGDGVERWLRAGASTVDAVDPYVSQDWDVWFNHGDKAMDERYEWVFNRFAGNPQVSLYRMTSDSYFDNADGPVDWVHIDGDHREESAYRDLVNAFDAVRDGGHIFMDDLQCKAWMEELGRAKARFEESHGDHLVCLQDTCDPVIWRVSKEQ